MQLSVTGRHLAVTDSIRQDITRKLGRLERLLGDSAVSAQVVVSRTAQTAVCEITVHARGDHMLHGISRHARMTTAVSGAVEKVAGQARRLKDRWKTRRRNAVGGRRATADAPAEIAAGAPATAGPRVIRRRLRLPKPMSVDDAILALDSETRSFLVFRSLESESVAVLYRRPDGHFGLLEPEG
jgi:putative sigma-54 modulation protein